MTHETEGNRSRDRNHRDKLHRIRAGPDRQFRNLRQRRGDQPWTGPNDRRGHGFSIEPGRRHTANDEATSTSSALLLCEVINEIGARRGGALAEKRSRAG
jgi:hypothetical protein